MKIKQGDKVLATWTDGLQLVGWYIDLLLGFHILKDEEGGRIVCNPDSCTLEKIEEREPSKDANSDQSIIEDDRSSSEEETEDM